MCVVVCVCASAVYVCYRMCMCDGVCVWWGACMTVCMHSVCVTVCVLTVYVGVSVCVCAEQ